MQFWQSQQRKLWLLVACCKSQINFPIRFLKDVLLPFRQLQLNMIYILFFILTIALTWWEVPALQSILLSWLDLSVEKVVNYIAVDLTERLLKGSLSLSSLIQHICAECGRGVIMWLWLLAIKRTISCIIIFIPPSQPRFRLFWRHELLHPTYI